MKNSFRALSLLGLGLGLFLSVAGAAPASDASTAKDLSALAAQLTKQAGQLDNNARLELLRYADQLAGWQANHQYAQLEQAFIRIRGLLPADDHKTAELLGRVEATLQQTREQARAKDEADYRKVEADFLARYKAGAPAAEFDGLLKQLAALTPQRNTEYGGASPQIESLRNCITQWQDYLLYSAAGSNDRAMSALDSLIQQVTRLPIIPRSQLVELRLAASGQAKIPGAAVDPVFTDLQRQLGVVLASATKASDLDAIVAAVRAANRANPNNSLLVVLQRTTLRWQDYYAAVDAGNGGVATNLLNNILSDDNAVAAMPRSKILAMQNRDRTNARLRDLVPPQELTLENIDLFMQQVNFRRTFGIPTEVNLDALRRGAGAITTPLSYLNQRQLAAVFSGFRAWEALPEPRDLGAYAEPLARLRQEIIRRALIALFDPPADVPPNKDDTLATYSARLVEYGKAQHNWPFVYKVLTLTRDQRVQTITLEPDLRALGSYLDGVQKELAGLWSEAAASYYNALAARSSLVPVDEIGERLQRIAKEHPAEYARVKPPG